MKKFYISIPEPCHEDWNQMSASEKGRFCGSCQKTVIDFTHMSDRELVAFFKKPAHSLCGRFHPDQLNREVTAPKKRIPWLKYFFTVTLPAFMLFLKSCNTKDRLTGDVVLNTSALTTNEVETMGITLPPLEETTESEVAISGIIEPSIDTSVSVADDMGKFEVIVGEYVSTIDTALQNDSDTAFVESCSKQLDTVVVESTLQTHSLSGVLGGISIRTTVQPAIESMPTNMSKKQAGLKVFPNPVKAGQPVTIKLSDEGDSPIQVQIITAAGQLMAIKKLTHSSELNATKVIIPFNMATGIYYVHVIYQSGHIEKSSILVSR